MTRTPLAFVLTLLGAGCSAIPRAQPPRPVAVPETPLDLSLAVSRPHLELSGRERAKGYPADEVLDPAGLAEEMAAWVRASRVFARVRQAAGAATLASRQAAWTRGDDLQLDLRVELVQTSFDGHNALWIPNVLNWAFWVVPAWFVATEEYSLQLAAQVRVWSTDSGRLLHQARLPVRVSGTFDEFDRGWQLLGFLYPFNDADNWSQVASRLLPAARSALGEALARELGERFYAQARTPALRRSMRKTLALVVGVSAYDDPVACPPLPSAARDAQEWVAALSGPGGLPERYVQALVGGAVTRTELEAALSTLRRRAHPQDQVVIYLACYGSRGPDGAPALLLRDADNQRGALTLESLARELSTIAGEKLLVLDTSFGCDGRGLAPAAQAGAPLDLSPLTRLPDVSLVLAAGADSPFRVAQQPESSLFGHLLSAEVQQAALSSAGVLDVQAAVARVVERTVADSAFFGPAQRPQAHLRPHFRLDLRGPGETRRDDPHAAK